MPRTGAVQSLVRRPFERSDVTISDASGTSDAQPERSTWGIAIEAPIEIRINDAPWTVMLATPADVDDLAIGLMLTERIVTDALAVQQVTVSEFLHDVSVNLVVPEALLDSNAIRSRSLAGNSACGLCGLQSLADLHTVAERRVATRVDRSGIGQAATVGISDAAILAAFASLPSQQPINRETHSVHAAAWCKADGTIVLVREDVGRHNALDKLIGAMARREMLHQVGFVVMSSRCSYELVYKAAVANALLLATISAPTSMALEWSRVLSLPVVCRIGGPDAGRVVRFDTGLQHAR